MNKKETGKVGSAHKKRGCGTAVLVFLSALLIIAGVVAYIFKDEIYLLYYAFTTSEEAVASQKVENDKKTQEILNEIAAVTMRDLTDEERQMLLEGKLSSADALILIQGGVLTEETTVADAPEETVDQPEETVITDVVTVPDTEEPQTTVPKEPLQTTAASTATTTVIDTEALLARQNEIIAEIFLLRATYLNEIDELIRTSKKDYVSLPKEKHNLNGKLEMVEKVIIPKGTALEKECDSRMKVLLDELTVILKQLGQGDSIVTEIKKAYQEQKNIKKTELINQYMPKAK